MDQQTQTQATKTQQRWEPPWWVVPTFSAVLAVVVPVLLSSLAGIGAFLVTGVVRLGQVGVGGFVLALLFALLRSAAAFVVGIRLCLSFLATSAGILFAALTRMLSRIAHGRCGRTVQQPASNAAKPCATPAGAALYRGVARVLVVGAAQGHQSAGPAVLAGVPTSRGGCTASTALGVAPTGV